MSKNSIANVMNLLRPDALIRPREVGSALTGVTAMTLATVFIEETLRASDPLRASCRAMMPACPIRGCSRR
jgi:hypothetical protein